VNWREFDGVLPELWRGTDSAIYRVPRKSTDPVRVIPRDRVGMMYIEPASAGPDKLHLTYEERTEAWIAGAAAITGIPRDQSLPLLERREP
jgi:hypothetical protein